MKEVIKGVWPGKVSVVLACQDENLSYLHRGKKSLAFRWPDYPELAELLKKTGPIISTSVNPEGGEPAKTVNEAKKYFGEKVDFYVDGGKLDSPPSRIISLDENGNIDVLR